MQKIIKRMVKKLAALEDVEMGGTSTPTRETMGVALTMTEVRTYVQAVV